LFNYNYIVITFKHGSSQAKTKGLPIGHYDTLIAAHARPLEATLITHNVREFERVDGLLFEDWEITA
jgi:tRNA(fMet)-specific endonuclease VapC